MRQPSKGTPRSCLPWHASPLQRGTLEPLDTANGDPGPQFPATVCCDLEVRAMNTHPACHCATVKVPSVTGRNLCKAQDFGTVPKAGLAAYSTPTSISEHAWKPQRDSGKHHNHRESHEHRNDHPKHPRDRRFHG